MPGVTALSYPSRSCQVSSSRLNSRYLFQQTTLAELLLYVALKPTQFERLGKSLRIINIIFVDSDIIMLPVVRTPGSNVLRLEHISDAEQLLQINCPSLRILQVNKG